MNVLFTLKKFLLLTSLTKTETTLQEGIWGTPEQRVEASKTVSWGCGGEEYMPWPPPGLVAPWLPARQWCFGGSSCFSETTSAFCRAEPVVFFQVAPVILTAPLAWGLHGQSGVSPGGSLVSLSVDSEELSALSWYGFAWQTACSRAREALWWFVRGWYKEGWVRNIWSRWTALRGSDPVECSRHLTLQQILCGLDKGCGGLGSEA